MNRRSAWALGLWLVIAQPHAALASEGAERKQHEAFHATRAPVPPFECEAKVGYDRDLVMPGYLLPTASDVWEPSTHPTVQP